MHNWSCGDCYGVALAMAHSFDRETPQGIETVRGFSLASPPALIAVFSMTSPLDSGSPTLLPVPILVRLNP